MCVLLTTTIEMSNHDVQLSRTYLILYPWKLTRHKFQVNYVSVTLVLVATVCFWTQYILCGKAMHHRKGKQERRTRNTFQLARQCIQYIYCNRCVLLTSGDKIHKQQWFICMRCRFYLPLPYYLTHRLAYQLR